MALDLDWSWSVELGRAAPRLTSRRRWKLYVVAWARHARDGILAGPWALGGRGGVGEPGLPEGSWDTHPHWQGLGKAGTRCSAALSTLSSAVAKMGQPRIDEVHLLSPQLSLSGLQSCVPCMTQ